MFDFAASGANDTHISKLIKSQAKSHLSRGNSVLIFHIETSVLPTYFLALQRLDKRFVPIGKVDKPALVLVQREQSADVGNACIDEVLTRFS